MKDCREAYLQQVESGLATLLKEDDFTNTINVIIECLEKYELTERVTEVGFHDNTSERLIQLYAGTLLTEGKSKKTVRGYVYFLRNFFCDINMRLADVGTMDIRIWLAKKQGKVTLRTCENYRSYLAAFFMWLTNEEYISKNPMNKIKPIKYVDEIREGFSDVELDAMRMCESSFRDRAILEFLVSSGVRVSELCALDRSDINFAEKSVLVKEGKGGKQRTTYINDVCILYLKKYLKERTDEELPLFVNKYNQRMSTGAIRKMLKKIGDTAHVQDVHPHRCRRTFATSMYRKGMDIHTIQRLLGHANINTTIGYIHDDQTMIAAAHRKYA